MKNIPQEKLTAIQQEVTGLVDDINNCVSWAEQYLDDETKYTTSYHLKKQRRVLNKIGSAVTQKPAIAFFGASQMGKSYMVKNLLCDEHGQLNIKNHSNEPVDFLSKINPDGKGAESTSLVTRFTAESVQDASLPPIKVKLLSPKDLAIILCDTYLSDFKTRREGLRQEDISEHLETLPGLLSNESQEILSEDDLYDIKEYLEANITQDDFLGKFRDAHFWQVVGENMHRLPAASWCTVLEILWNRNPDLSALFRSLIAELERVGFAAIGYTDFTAVKKEGKSIIDVTTLNGLMSNEEAIYNLKTAAGDFKIRPGYLCALSAELIIGIADQSVERRSFIKSNDILDFPGARSRLELTEQEKLEPENLSQMLLRGKVSYLFNTYSQNYEINNLCVCTSSTRQPDGRAVPGLVKGWIDRNIGESAAERGRVLKEAPIPPLFVIFTFWNERLQYDKRTDGSDFQQRLTKTFVTRYEEDLKSETRWAEQWTTIAGAETFKNFYLLRDFLYSDKTFLSDDGEETAIDDDHVDFMDTFQKLFMDSSLVARFFADKSLAWNESSTPGKDGADLIIKNLEMVANNHTRTLRYITIIDQCKRAVLQEMNKFHHSDKADEQIRKAVMQCGELTMAMDTLFDIDKIYTSLFGKFIERISLAEQEIYRHFHNKIRGGVPKENGNDKPHHLIYERAQGISKDKTYEENLEILRKSYSFATAADTERHFEEMNIDLHRFFYQRSGGLDNKSDILANEARAFWFDNKLKPENFQYFLDMGLKEAYLENLFRNLRVSFDKLKITDVIASQIRSYVDRYNRIDAAEDMIAHITAGVINEFVSSLGWTYFSQAEKEKVASIKPVIADLTFDLPLEEEVFKPVDRSSLEELYGILREINEDNKNNKRLDPSKTRYIPMIKNYKKWTGLLKVLFISNCDIPVYDPVANQKIGEALALVEQHEFSV